MQLPKFNEDGSDDFLGVAMKLVDEVQAMAERTEEHFSPGEVIGLAQACALISIAQDLFMKRENT